MLYITVFLISCFFIHFSEKYNKNKTISLYLLSIGLIIPAVLAGVRDYSIGTDVNVYGNTTFYLADASSSIMNYIKISSLEFLYSLTNYIVSRFTDNPHWFYFYIALFMNVFSFMGISRYNNIKKTNKAFAMFIYYLLFYNQNLNILRQSMAISIIIYAVNYIFEKKYIKYIIWCIIAMQFHTSAIICILFLPIYLYIQKKNNIISYITVIIVAIVSVIMYSKISIFLINNNILPAKYIRYLSTSDEFVFQLESIIVRLPLIAVMILFNKGLYDNDKNNAFFLLAMILEVIFMQMEGFVQFASRINIYIMIFRIFSLNNIAFLVTKEKFNNIKINNSFILKSFIILYSFVVWYYSIIVQNNNCTYPYTSTILGI